MGIVRIRLNFTYQDQKMNNVLHYVYQDNEVRDYQIAADYIRDAWVNGLALRIADECSFDSITYNELAVQSVDTEQDFTLGAATGNAGAGKADASQLAMLVSLQGSVPFKPNRGRIYLCGFADDQLQDGRYTVQARDAAEAWAVSMKTVPAGGPTGLALCIYSKTNVKEGVGLTHNEVDNIIARRSVATQRRRRLGEGQ